MKPQRINLKSANAASNEAMGSTLRFLLFVFTNDRVRLKKGWGIP
jgi:hypothetical protein